MGFVLASSPILTWSRASSVGGSHCSKQMSHSMFRCLIQGSSLVSISSISSSSGSGWAETMLTETGSNSVPTLTSELKDEVSEEWSYLANGLESTSDWFGVQLVRRGAVPQSSVVLPAARVESLQRCFSSFALV